MRNTGIEICCDRSMRSRYVAQTGACRKGPGVPGTCPPIRDYKRAGEGFLVTNLVKLLEKGADQGMDDGLISHGISPTLWLGYLDSNQEQLNQNQPCCQLHHTPRHVPASPAPRVNFSGLNATSQTGGIWACPLQHARASLADLVANDGRRHERTGACRDRDLLGSGRRDVAGGVDARQGGAPAVIDDEQSG